jgi:hypothetical protein
MRRVLRGCQATIAALALSGLAPAHAAAPVWQFSQDEESAFLGIGDPAVSDSEADYPFYMSCASTGDETTVVSDIDAKALGESIAKGDVPSFTYLLDGEKQDDSGGEVADIRFDEMAGVWQYIVNGADYDLLLTAEKSIKVNGVGIDLDLPQKDMKTSLQQFKDACDALISGGDDSGDSNGDAGRGDAGSTGDGGK